MPHSSSFLKLRATLGLWRRLDIRKTAYLVSTLSRKEQRAFLLIFLTLCASGGILFARLYIRATEPAPAVGKTYTEGILGEPRIINPLFHTQDSERDIARLVYAGLFSYNHKGELELDMADSYETSEDGLAYAVRLKENLFWHDGERVTADDVIFTIRIIQNPQYKSPRRQNWQGVVAEKNDDRTIRFVLPAPYVPFLENLTVGILPRHIWTNVGPDQILLHEQNLRPIGSGPYQFKKFRQNKDGTLILYHLVRNPRYHRKGPYIKNITFLFFETGEELRAAWRKGAIEGFNPASVEIPEEISKTKSKLHALTTPRVFGIFFNQKRAPGLDDIRVRQAIAHAIRKNGIADLLSSQGAVITDFPLPWIPPDDPIRYGYDPNRSKDLLADAGWTDENGDGVREKQIKKETKELRFTLSTSDWQNLASAAERIKIELEAVGIGITIETKPFLELESTVIRPREFDMLLFGQVYGYEPDPFAFWHTSQSKDPGLNITAYANSRADKLLEEARSARKLEEREQKFKEFSALLQKDLPAVFLYTQLYLYIFPTDIEGVEFDKIVLPTDRFNEIHAWYRTTRRVFQ